jgi:hypothetical protein
MGTDKKGREKRGRLFIIIPRESAHSKDDKEFSLSLSASLRDSEWEKLH